MYFFFLFSDLGLAGCIEHVWRDTIVYLDNDDPILIGRAYGRVSRNLLHEELVKRLGQNRCFRTKVNTLILVLCCKYVRQW